MRIVFCCLGDFRAPPGARQILLLAKALEDAGHECLVLVEGDPSTVHLVPEVSEISGVGRFRFVGPRLADETVKVAAAFAPTLVHCYEPRTAPLAAALTLAKRLRIPLCVRFADDDELLYREAGGSGLRQTVGRPALIAAGTVVPRLWPFKHPLHHRRMLDKAAGFDAITPALAAQITARYGVPCHSILPVVPLGCPLAPSSGTVRDRLGIPLDGPMLLYTGSVFRAHLSDFELLLRAFSIVSDRRPDARLVHTGRLADRYDHDTLRALTRGGAARTHFLGFLERPKDLRELMASAAVLVQPGAPNDFNRFRLPAKVHDYLMAARPVVTFGVGFGELLTDRRHAVLTHTDDPAELADAIEFVLDDPRRANEVAQAGFTRARELFAPERIVGETEKYYRDALVARPPLARSNSGG